MRRSLVVLATFAAFVLVACGGDDDVDAAGTTESTTTMVETTTTTTTIVMETTLVYDAAFCDVAASLEGEVPEAYVGSPQHVEDVRRLLAVTPEVLRPAVDTYLVFLEDGGVDPDDPSTNETDSWPPEVQDAVAAIAVGFDTRC